MDMDLDTIDFTDAGEVVDAASATLYGRELETEGQDFWAARIEDGLKIGKLLALLTGADEFQLKSPAYQLAALERLYDLFEGYIRSDDDARSPGVLYVPPDGGQLVFNQTGAVPGSVFAGGNDPSTIFTRSALWMGPEDTATVWSGGGQINVLADRDGGVSGALDAANDTVNPVIIVAQKENMRGAFELTIDPFDPIYTLERGPDGGYTKTLLDSVADGDTFFAGTMLVQIHVYTFPGGQG